MSSHPLRLAFLIAVCLGGIALRILFAVYAEPSTDLANWYRAVEGVHRSGLGLFSLYRIDAQFNNPPLALVFVDWIYDCSLRFDVSFATLFRLLQVVADIATALLLGAMVLLKHPGSGERFQWLPMTGLYLLNPVALILSGQHGHTDSLATFLLLLSVFFVERRRFCSSGIVLALALDIKLIPFLAFLPLCALTFERGELFRFLRGFCLGLSPLVPALLVVPQDFTRHVLGYNSVAGAWGVPFLIGLLAQAMPAGSAFLMLCSKLYTHIARYIVLSTSLLFGLGVYRAKLSLRQALLLSFASFLLLAPGIGVQYFAFLVPFLLLEAPRWAMAFSIIAGMLLALEDLGVVQIVNDAGIVIGHRPSSFTGLMGFLVWITLAWGLGEYLRAVSLARRSAAAS